MSSAKSNLAVFGGLLILSLGLQWHSGAWESDFGGHADEAAHVVTGLMVRDYLAGGFLDQPHPIRFAEHYYERFPKVAIGHYPPLFYLAEGLWLLPLRSGGAVLVLMSVLAAAAGWLTWRGGRRFLSASAAVAAALVFCLLPLVRTYTAVVMSDLLLVILGLSAVTTFGRFLETGTKRDSLLFGFLAAAAILTKGAGLFLALVPPLAILLTGKWPILKRPSLWLAPVAVLLLALPWMLLTRQITAEGMQEISIRDYLPNALAFYGRALLREFEIVLLLAALAAVSIAFIRARRAGEPIPVPIAVHTAAIVSLLVFFLSIPSGVDARYLLPAAPSIVLLGFSIRRMRAGLAAMTAILFLAPILRPVTKLHTGAAGTIETIHEQSGPGPVRILVSSSPNGEGALIAAAALKDPIRFRMIRASKALAESDWLGRGYRNRFGSADELIDFLVENDAVPWLVLDGDIPEWHYRPHHQLVKSVAENHRVHFRPAGTIVSRRKVHGDSEFRIYRPEPKSNEN